MTLIRNQNQSFFGSTTNLTTTLLICYDVMNACLPPPVYWPCHLRYYWWMTALTQCTHPRSLHHWWSIRRWRHEACATPRPSTPRIPYPHGSRSPNSGLTRNSPTQLRNENDHSPDRPGNCLSKGNLDWTNQVEWFELRVIPRKTSRT